MTFLLNARVKLCYLRMFYSPNLQFLATTGPNPMAGHIQPNQMCRKFGHRTAFLLQQRAELLQSNLLAEEIIIYIISAVTHIVGIHTEHLKHSSLSSGSSFPPSLD